MNEIENKINEELEFFREEIEGDIQVLYTYLTIHAIASKDKTIHKKLKETSWFWATTLYSLQSNIFIGLGRIFDQKSPHNIDRLFKLFQDNHKVFSKESLGNRKTELTQIDKENYLSHAYVPNTKDFRRLRKYKEKWRGIYKKNYKAIRNKIFAHNEIYETKSIEQQFKNTNIKELEFLYISVLKFYKALWELFHNGHKPTLKPMRYSIKAILKKRKKDHKFKFIQEEVVYDTEALLLKLNKKKIILT